MKHLIIMSRKGLTSSEEKKISKICDKVGLIKDPIKTTNNEILIEIQKEIDSLNGELSESEEKTGNESKTNVYIEMLKGNKKYLDFFFIKMKQTKYVDFDFKHKHVMYFLLTNISIKGKNINYFVIKMGYSCDVFKRIKDIEAKFGIMCYPLYIKEIRTVHDEKILHNYMSKNYPKYDYVENEFPKKIKEKKTEEFYYGTKHIFDLFVSYVENIICDNEYKMEIEKTKQKQIEKEMKEIEKEKEIKKIEHEKEIKKMEIFKLLIENNTSLDEIKKYMELLRC